MAGALLEAMLQCAEASRPSTGQDMLKGRWTAIDGSDSPVAAKSEAAGIPAPTHLVQRVECGEIAAHPRHVEGL